MSCGFDCYVNCTELRIALVCWYVCTREPPTCLMASMRSMKPASPRAYPALRPARPAHLEKVLHTIRLGYFDSSSSAEQPAKSAYASSTTMRASSLHRICGHERVMRQEVCSTRPSGHATRSLHYKAIGSRYKKSAVQGHWVTLHRVLNRDGERKGRRKVGRKGGSAKAEGEQGGSSTSISELGRRVPVGLLGLGRTTSLHLFFLMAATTAGTSTCAWSQ